MDSEPVQPGEISFDNAPSEPFPGTAPGGNDSAQPDRYLGYDFTPEPLRRGIPDEAVTPEPAHDDELAAEPENPDPGPGISRSAPPGPVTAAAPVPDMQPDPDRLDPGLDAKLPDLESMWQAVAGAHTAPAPAADSTASSLHSAIGEMAAAHGMWFRAWQDSGLTPDQAFELLRVLVRQQFRN